MTVHGCFTPSYSLPRLFTYAPAQSRQISVGLSLCKLNNAERLATQMQ